MSPLSRVIWRAARDTVGGKGLFLEQIEALCHAESQSYSVRARLQQMVARGYLLRLGDRHSPRWVINMNVPDGESDEVGAPPVDSRSAFARPFDALESTVFVGRLKVVPTSVWHMARLLAAVEGAAP